MTIQYINTGTSPNAGNGDSLRVAFTKINANFSSLAGSSSVNFPSQTGHAGQFLTTDGGALSWAAVSGAGGLSTATVIVSNIAPRNPVLGELWYDDVSGRLYVWYDTFWVDASPRGNANVSTLVNGTYTFALTTSGSVVLNGSAFTGGSGSSGPINHLTSGTAILRLGTDGSTSLPGSLDYKVVGLGGSGHFDINSWYPVKITTGDAGDVPYSTWTFGWDQGGGAPLTFPDSTAQTTAWTGIVDGGRADNDVPITYVSSYNIPDSGGITITYNITTSTAQSAGVILQGLSTVYTQNTSVDGFGNPAPFSLGDNSFTFGFDYELAFQTVNVIPYMVDSRGYTFYAQPGIWTLDGIPCLVEGTEITMADGSRKLIEDIEYSDLIKVWNFDLGEFSEAKPIWIKVAEEIGEKYRFKFSDGTVLNTVGHQVFNQQAGKFTHFIKDTTPVGTTTFNDKGEEVTLISKEKILEPVRYYNVLTRYHFNLFANGILTSNTFNNIYPIKDRKFVKDDRQLRPLSDFEDIDQQYIDGLRLREQVMDLDYMKRYIRNRFIRLDVANTAEQGIE